MARPNGADESIGRTGGMTSFESRLLNLLALILVQERQQTEQIRLLARAGFGAAEIAAMLGTTRNTVSVELSRQKMVKRGKRSKRGSKKAKQNG